MTTDLALELVAKQLTELHKSEHGLKPNWGWTQPLRPVETNLATGYSFGVSLEITGQSKQLKRSNTTVIQSGSK